MLVRKRNIPVPWSRLASTPGESMRIAGVGGVSHLWRMRLSAPVSLLPGKQLDLHENGSRGGKMTVRRRSAARDPVE